MWTRGETCVGSGANRELACKESEWCRDELLALPREPSGTVKISDELAEWVHRWKSDKGQPNTWGRQENGFYFCTYCRKPRRNELVRCPNCGNYFQGPRPNFPIDYECSMCE